MVIIFYDPEKEIIYVCTEREKMKIISVDDPNLIANIPNDDILYVQNAQFITKCQFQQWLEGDIDLEDEQDTHSFTGLLSENNPKSSQVDRMVAASQKYTNSKWIHPAHNGTILIPDLKTEQYPHGLEMIGKYDFIPVDAIGGFEALEESILFKSLLAKGKIEVVDYDYVKKNYRKKQQSSASDAALDAILIKDSTRGAAEAVAASGGIDYEASGAVEFLVE